MALLNRSYYTIESNSIFLNGQSSTTLYAVIVFLGRFTYKNLVNYKMVKHISTCITQIDKSHLPELPKSDLLFHEAAKNVHIKGQ